MLDYLGEGSRRKPKITRKRGKHVQIRRKNKRPSWNGGKVGGLDYFKT